jgi:hypothetical protein
VKEFSHYFRDIAGLSKIDIYRFLELFGVTKSTYQHAVKKIVCAGQRGAKDERKDIGEAIVSLTRALEMLDEDERAATIRKAVESGDIVLEFGEPAIDQLDGYHRTITLDVPMGLTAGRTVEPAAEIDESRADRVASSHGDGEHYAYVCGVCHHMTKQGVRHICQ